MACAEVCKEDIRREDSRTAPGLDLRAGTDSYADDPVGPPQRWAVVANLLLRSRIRFVDEYPKVMASTKRAPGMRAGLGTGISKNRQPAPTAKLIARPMRNFICSP